MILLFATMNYDVLDVIRMLLVMMKKQIIRGVWCGGKMPLGTGSDNFNMVNFSPTLRQGFSKESR